MTKVVFLTADHAMGQARDRGMLRDNQRWAAQVAAHSRADPAASGEEYWHHHVTGRYRSAASIRRAIVEGYTAAATIAAPDGWIVALMGHGSDAMCDVGPAPHFRVNMDVVRAANNFAGSAGFETEAEALLNLRRAVGGRVSELRFATCNMARGTGTSFLRSLGAVIQVESRPTLYGLDGFLWSQDEGRSVAMGVIDSRGGSPARLYRTELWRQRWYPQRTGSGAP